MQNLTAMETLVHDRHEALRRTAADAKHLREHRHAPHGRQFVEAMSMFFFGQLAVHRQPAPSLDQAES